MSPMRKALLKWARRIHLYLTLFTLGLILLFAVTGFMLNHEDWFVSGEPNTRTVEGKLPLAMLSGPDRLAVVETLRNNFSAVGPVDSFEEQDDTLTVVFKRPGLRVEAVIQRDGGETTLAFESKGLNGILLDLHRGKSTGWLWSLVIDGLCVCLVITALTGLVLWSSLKDRGRPGLVVMAAGVAASVAVVWWFAMG
ncbi:MAG: hypothetical protein EBV06_09440 [Planctomycetia bacterium]|nr:hypothetical protein [Planctomycetia bacterium]